MNKVMFRLDNTESYAKRDSLSPIVNTGLYFVVDYEKRGTEPMRLDQCSLLTPKITNDI